MEPRIIRETAVREATRSHSRRDVCLKSPARSNRSRGWRASGLRNTPGHRGAILDDQMTTAKQRAAARRNIKKAAQTAKRKRTIAHLPKKTRTADTVFTVMHRRRTRSPGAGGS